MKVSKKLLNKITLKLKPYMSELVNIAENCCEENGEGEWYNGIFEYNVPTGYTALSTKGLNL